MVLPLVPGSTTSLRLAVSSALNQNKPVSISYFCQTACQSNKTSTTTWEEVDTYIPTHMLLKDRVLILIFPKWSWVNITYKYKSLYTCLTSALSSSSPKIYQSSSGMKEARELCLIWRQTALGGTCHHWHTHKDLQESSRVRTLAASLNRLP